MNATARRQGRLPPAKTASSHSTGTLGHHRQRPRSSRILPRRKPPSGLAALASLDRSDGVMDYLDTAFATCCMQELDHDGGARRELAASRSRDHQHQHQRRAGRWRIGRPAAEPRASRKTMRGSSVVVRSTWTRSRQPKPGADGGDTKDILFGRRRLRHAGRRDRRRH